MGDPTPIIQRGLLGASRSGDTLSRGPRANQYGELLTSLLHPNFNELCEEGSYFVATSPTPGTGIAWVTSSAFADTAAFLSVRNNDGAGGKRIYLDYVRLIVTTPPTAAASAQLAMKLDIIQRDSAGTVATPTNPNEDVGAGSIAIVRANPTVAAASSSARLIGRSALRSVIPVVNDEWILKFGSVEAACGTSLGGAVAQRMLTPLGPCIIGPGQSAFFHLWFPSSSAALSAEFDLGWAER